MRTGKPIVYTSADSVFQVAAHEDVVPIAEQYRICKTAFELASRGAGIGRVIARPFGGAPGAYTRTANRHDYALDPTGDTLLDWLTRNHVTVVSIGKISDLFAGRGITRSLPTSSDADGLDKLGDDEGTRRLIAVVGGSTVYGHRNDVAATGPREVRRATQYHPPCCDGDVLVVTADPATIPARARTIRAINARSVWSRFAATDLDACVVAISARRCR
jgi:phosphopentomutase